jgi:hypothetical protein
MDYIPQVLLYLNSKATNKKKWQQKYSNEVNKMHNNMNITKFCNTQML